MAPRTLRLRAVLALLAVVVVAGPAAASASTPGYTWNGSKPSGLEGPLRIYVYTPAGGHVGGMVAAAKFASAHQRRHGVRIAYAGYTQSRHYDSGRVTFFSSPRNCGSGGVGFGIPIVRNRGALFGVFTGSVQFCPIAFRSDDRLRRTVLHELGHVLALGHFSGQYSGRYQMMNPYVQRAPSAAYQPGDVNGLHQSDVNSARLAGHGYGTCPRTDPACYIRP